MPYVLWGESSLPLIARFRRQAYPMREEVTNRVWLGRRSHGCPSWGHDAVGATWMASKPVGLNIKE